MDVCNFNWNVMGLRTSSQFQLYIYDMTSQTENEERIAISDLDHGFKLIFYKKIGDAYIKYHDGVAWLLSEKNIIGMNYFFLLDKKRKQCDYSGIL